MDFGASQTDVMNYFAVIWTVVIKKVERIRKSGTVNVP